MALIDIHVDLHAAVKLLERIANALDRAFPLPLDKIEPSTEEDFHTIAYDGRLYTDRKDIWDDFSPRSNYPRDPSIPD
jgi:hypothetical protein